jgi:hypothetical protein
MAECVQTETEIVVSEGEKNYNKKKEKLMKELFLLLILPLFWLAQV